MKQLMILVKTGLLNQLHIQELKNNKDTKKKRRMILMLCVFAFLGLILIFYSALSAYGLLFAGMGELIPAGALCAAGIMTFMFTTLKTNGILFGYKDYDLLTALPVKTSTLVAARFMQLYMSNLALSALIMAPMGIVMGIVLQKNIGFYLMWLIAIPFAPLIPTTVAAILGVLIMSIASRMKHANVVNSILSMLLVIGILVFSTAVGSKNPDFSLLDLSSLKETAMSALAKVYPVSIPFDQAVNRSNWLGLVLFTGGSYLWYKLFTILTGMKYRRIQTALSAHKISSHKVHDLKSTTNSVFTALFKKEWKRFLQSNVILMNMGIGVVMLLLAVGGLFFLDTKTLQSVLAESSISLDLEQLGAYLVPFILAGIGGMSCPACCSLSLEGSNINLLKSLPLRPITVYSSKIAMNLSLTLPPTLLGSLLMSVRYAKDPLQVIMIFLYPLVANTLAAVWGMFINIKMPNYTWDNEIAIAKQSLPAFFGIFSSILLALLEGALVFLLPAEIRIAIMALLTAVHCGIIYLLYSWMKKRSGWE